MAKFKAVVEGRHARKPVETTDLGGRPLRCDVRALFGEDEEKVLSIAVARAKELGIPPTEGEPGYDFAYACAVVALGCVDSESPKDAPEPFFESVEQVRKHLDRDRILLLAEAQQSFQDEVSPRRRTMTVEEFVPSVVEHATAGENDRLPFEFWGPVIRRSWVRTLASQYVELLKLSSASGLVSGLDSPDTSSPTNARGDHH